MDKAMNMGKSSATGSFQLLIGVVASTVIMAVGTIILTRIMPSSADYGLYGAAMIPSSIINFFRDWGVNSAMTKQIASLRAAKRDAEIHDVIVSGVVFEIPSGAALSLLCFVLAGFLAAVLQAPEASTFISIMSLSIFAGAILAAASSIFIGFEKMKLNSFTSICQAIVKTAVGPLLVLFGYGVLGAIIGAVAAIVAGGFIGIAVVYLVLFRPLRKLKVGRSEILKTLNPMLKYGVPLAVSNIVMGFLPLLFNFLMVIYAGNAMYGDYLAAVNFSVLLTFFTVPISTVLFPAFAKLNAKEESDLLKTVFASSVKYTAVLVVPATMAMMVLSNPIVNTLFGYTPTGDPKYAFAPFFLTLAVVANLFTVIGNISMGTFLTGIGETKLLMKQGLLTLIIGLPLAFVLVPPFGVVGGIIGVVASGVPSMIWGLYWIWKNYKVKADFRISAKILAASSLASAATFLLLSVLNAADWIRLVSGVIVFLVLYLTTAPLIGAINQADVSNFRAMLSGLGIVSKLLEIPLKFIEKPLQMRKKQTEAKAK